MFRAITPVYCDNLADRFNALCGQNAECLDITISGVCNCHCDLKGSSLLLPRTLKFS
jgi:hypothetical protein